MLAGWEKIAAVTRDDLPPLMRKQIELEENIARKALTWNEEIQAKLELDEIMRAEHGSALQGRYTQGKKKGWGIEDTAIMLNESIGTVSQDIKLAKILKERPRLAIEVSRYPKVIANKKVRAILEAERLKEDNKGKPCILDLRLGNCITLLKELKDESVDLLLTDPPYGIADIMEAEGSYNVVAADKDNWEKDQVLLMFTELFPILFKKLKPSSHFYFFYGSEMYQDVKTLLENCGFYVDPVPLIWYKTRSTTPFKGLSYMGSYEPFLFGCKPPREKYLKKPANNVFAVSSPKERAHVFHKPAELVSFLIENSTNEGALVLDPFAGSGQVLLSSYMLKRKSIGFEINEDNWNKANEFLRKSIDRINRDGITYEVNDD